ncbi:MAG: FlgD immunoglobulin-like domain containing protein, partial [Acidobacteriota bacterium]
AAGGVSTASISLVAPAAEGEAVLVAVLDPDGAVEEGSEANNSAALEYGVQSGDVAASPRYISPDGDGVQDAATVLVRSAADAVRIEVLDRADDVVAELDAEAVDGETRAVWDGRGLNGRLVPDGDYVVQATAAGAVLAEARVAVDTNRAPLLDALGTELADERCVTCGIPRPSSGVIPTADEEWFFFRLTVPEGDFPAGVYRVAFDGTQLQTLFATSGNDRVLDLDVAPSGEAYVVRVENPFRPLDRYFEMRFLDGQAFRVGDANIVGFDFFDATGDYFFDRSGSELYRYRTEGVRIGEAGELWATLPAGSSVDSVSPTGAAVLLTSTSGSQTRAWLLDLASADLRELPVPSGERLDGDAVWSWDGSRVLFKLVNTSGGEGGSVELDEIVVFDRVGGLRFPTAPGRPGSTV